MPTVVSPRHVRLRQAALLLPLMILIGLAFWHQPQPLTHAGCIETDSGINVCAASSMARVTRTGASLLEHPQYDLNETNSQRLRFRMARNETIAFQLILRRQNRHSAA